MYLRDIRTRDRSGRAVAIVSSLLSIILAVVGAAAISTAASAQGTDAAGAGGSEAGFAKQLANPISSLISVPFQNNYDCCFGPAGGYRYTLNVQPVIPFSLNNDWNVIVRTIVPIVYQAPTTTNGGGAGGFSDVTQSFFFSPKAATNGIIWGVGPALLYPLGSSQLGSQKWGAGPTIVLLKQSGAATYGILANQIWSYAGASNRASVNQLFLQPFYNYTFPDSTGVVIQTQTTYNWTTRQWTVPILLGVSHVYKIQTQLIQLAMAAKGYAATPTGGPGYGFQWTATLLFPKR
jgi:hypothetical protein